MVAISPFFFFFNTGATFSALTEGPSLLSSSPTTIMGLSG